MALATEASFSIATTFTPQKSSCSQFWFCLKTPNPSSTMGNEMLRESCKGYFGRAQNLQWLLQHLM